MTVVHVLVLAVAAAFYPTLLAGVIIILARPRPVRLLAAFLAGGMTMSILIGLFLLGALEGSGLADRSQQATPVGLTIGVGLLSLGVAYALATGREKRFTDARARRRARRPAKPAKTPLAERYIQKGSAPVAFALGIVLNLPGAWYVAALSEMSSAGYPTSTDLLLIVAFNLIMFALIEIPLVTYLLAPERAEALVARINTW